MKPAPIASFNIRPERGSRLSVAATCRWAQRRKIGAIPTDGGVSNLDVRVKATSIEERAAIVHDELCRRIVIECNRRRLVP